MESNCDNLDWTRSVVDNSSSISTVGKPGAGGPDEAKGPTVVSSLLSTCFQSSKPTNLVMGILLDLSLWEYYWISLSSAQFMF